MCISEAIVAAESVTHFGYEALFQCNMAQGSQAGMRGRKAACTHAHVAGHTD